tara:strand:+ start:784 stop:987 length:204 start_codon:yes stop_codon:yes gene_type:complete
MTDMNLSWDYAKACRMIHNLTALLYEELHKENGNPHKQAWLVDEKIKQFRERIDIEIDLIQEAVKDE